MKTLDEVIALMEGIEWEDWGKDALHYLKEYRAEKDKVEFLRAHIQCLEEDEQRNDPLTWDQLKQMEGKPVWVEGEHGCIWDQKSWVLIRLDKENDDLIICVGTDNGHYEFAIDKEDYGTDWQAYRKERE